MRVAYTLEQCWHRVPGGTAVAALRVAEAFVLPSHQENFGVAVAEALGPAVVRVAEEGRHRCPTARCNCQSATPAKPIRKIPVKRYSGRN